MSQKHLVLISSSEAEEIISGKSKYIARFFKRKPEFLSKLSVGDIVFFRKKGEILGQFEIGKLITIERLDVGDWKLVKEIGSLGLDLSREQFIEKIKDNNALIVIQIEKLEQFITSPIEVDKRSKKEWIILDGN